ncbi:MAG: hypothetical protein LBD64_07955 [Odoribacteraceae bacterium]|jgi:hypothetical protein|nr:hypothetical protein [Odoribacteraceae bacterium]
MKRAIHYSWTCLLLVAAIACEEREGTSGLYVEKTFVPIKNVRGEGGYGNATFTWEKPDSTSSLLCTKLTWETPNGATGQHVINRYWDTLRLSELPGNDYNFRFVSIAEDGASVEVAAIPLTIQDQELEPPALLVDFNCLSAENTLLIYWKEPQHPTYARAVFEIYRSGAILESETIEKGSTGEISITDLEYNTAYELRYYSLSERGIRSEERVIPFSTGGSAPAVPGIQVSTSRIDYAHSAEITWTVNADIDSLLVRFIDLNGENRAYRFGGNRGREYLSPLPGGTTELKVQVRGTDGTWSLPQSRVIRTRLTDETYALKVPNGPTSNLSKLSERFYQALGHGTHDDYKAHPESAIYSFQEMARLKEITLEYEIYNIDELELLVSLEALRINANAPALDLCPQVEYFLLLINRLPHIREIIVHPNYPRHDQLKSELEGNTKVTFKSIEI